MPHTKPSLIDSVPYQKIYFSEHRTLICSLSSPSPQSKESCLAQDIKISGNLNNFIYKGFLQNMNAISTYHENGESKNKLSFLLEEVNVKLMCTISTYHEPHRIEIINFLYYFITSLLHYFLLYYFITSLLFTLLLYYIQYKKSHTFRLHNW